MLIELSWVVRTKTMDANSRKILLLGRHEWILLLNWDDLDQAMMYFQNTTLHEGACCYLPGFHSDTKL